MDSENIAKLRQLLKELRKQHFRNKSKIRRHYEGASSKSRKRQLARIIIRDRGVCHICKEVTENPSRDHIISLAEIKANPEICSIEYFRSDENVRLACRSCNSYRRAG